MRCLQIPLTVLVFAASSTAGGAPSAPCEALAARVKVAAAVPHALDRPKDRSYDYQALFAPIVDFPPPQLADGALQARARRFLGPEFGEVFEVQHLAGADWRAEQVQGSAACQTEKFFSVRPDGELSALDTPPTFGPLCWKSFRRIGTVDAKPALIEEEILEHPLLGVDVEITPWTGGRRTACRVAVRFNDVFEVTERFCKDSSLCLSAEPLAPKLAEALARAADGAALKTVAPPTPPQGEAMAARLAAAKTRFESAEFGYTELPTFGAKPKTEHPSFAGSPQVTLISAAGKTLIARVGIGGVGWRELGDYLITLYGGGDDLDPLASFVVERRNTGLRSVVTSMPIEAGAPATIAQ